MARISMRNVQKSSVSEYFDLYLSSAAARGVKDKTLQTYKNHFRSIAKRMDVTVPMNRLNSQDLENMILSMREEGLSASSINSYTRTLKVFFSWCNEEGHTSLNIKLYKAPETVKEVYTDEELMILLKKPEANCNFCEYRNWVIINFLLNSGCRAATVRNIQIQDGDLRKMLSKPTTKDFFQIKTAPLKLRRELQGINFITTLEIEHAILRSTGNRAEVVQILSDEGYSQEEIHTAIDCAIEYGNIETEGNGNLIIKAERVPTVRRYCFLDLIANYGQAIDEGVGYLIVAGYSHTWGLLQADLVRIALDRIPNLQNYWQNPVDPFEDIQWLLNFGFVKTI